jgi:hypothetical protein
MPSTTPLNCNLAEEHKKYTDNMLQDMLCRAEEHLSVQRQHEGEQAVQMEGAQAEHEHVEACVEVCYLPFLALEYSAGAPFLVASAVQMGRGLGAQAAIHVRQ